MKFTNLYSGESEGLHVVDNNQWHCEIDDKKVQLSLLLEVIDMNGATGEPEFKDYPFLFSVGIIASKPHKSFYEGEGKPSRLELLADCNGYMGTVPVDHFLLSTDSINKKLIDDLKASKAKIVTVKRDFGTIAAQQGKNSEFSYPQFKTADDAYNFAKSLIEAYGNTVMTLIGFTLDKPINMMGETGWSVVSKQIEGVR